MNKIRLLILGTGGMAANHAEAFAAIDGVDIVAGVDTNTDRLSAFCEKHDISNGFSTLDEALAWGAFDAVTNVTPDGAHAATTLPLLTAGKHVLCEKPLATTYADAREMAITARHAGVINMVNLSYRNGASLMHAAHLIGQGAIGAVRHFEASYLQSWLTQPAWGDWKTDPTWLWRLSTRHGSKGVLGDVGVHILDFATLAAGSRVDDISCRLTTFDKAPGGAIGAYTLDANDSATMQVRLQNGAVGVVHASRFATGHLNDLTLRIHGTDGAIEVCDHNHKSTMRACLGDDRLTATWRDITSPPVRTNFVRFIDAIREGAAVLPDFDRGAALQKVLDAAETSHRGNGIFVAV
ncbi:Gfo/Idh/MocA family protein [Celeribacter sp.]|uniref:Gfo/Idh/MocA family protein n=1 Tax=Celeribacter sp. TaxID=1890673 RepID=UPI003A957FB6